MSNPIIDLTEASRARAQTDRFKKGFIDKTQVITIVTNGSADTEEAETHGLGVVPTGYIVIGRDKAGVIYDGTTAWTKDVIYVRSDLVTVTAKLLVF